MSERLYAEAEKRLGRPLSEGERRIDIARYEHDLESGKKKLHQAIEKEKSRVIAARLKGRRTRMKVTPEMIEALAFLHRRGLAHARAELRRAGVEPSRRMASKEELAGLRSLLSLLRSLLGRVTRRVELELQVGRTKKIEVSLTSATISALARAMEKKVPGSLAVAADLVSSAMAGGLEEGFEGDADLFQYWEWSAIMDGGTCGPCREMDGKHFPSFAAIMAVGFPYPNCLGGTRCRCRPVPGPLKAIPR